MLWIGGGSGREIVFIWQPVQLEREIATGARACVVKHLSTSHRNDSHDPVGRNYFTALVSHSNLLATRMMIAMGFMSAGAVIYNNCLRTLVWKVPSLFRIHKHTCSLWIRKQIEQLRLTQGHMASVHCNRTQRCLRKGLKKTRVVPVLGGQSD